MGYTHTWTYDDCGNITCRTAYGYTTGDLAGVPPTETVPYTYNEKIWFDLLRTYGDSARFSYDSAGNLTSDGVWTYWWKHGRQLAYMKQGTLRWDYTYDANGLRTKRTNGTDTYTYVYNGSMLAMMTVGENTLSFTYDAAGTPLAVQYNGTTYYYKTNLQGDILGITDGSGTEVVTYVYNAWGVILACTGTMADTLGVLNPLRYRGYVYDPETELYYLQSRYYNPAWGRFINADALVYNDAGILGFNMFAYCINNPVNMVDVAGYKPEYITDQYPDYEIDGVKMKDISFGLGNIADHGCGVIAAYNVLAAENKNLSFNKVKNEIIARGGLNAAGLWGTTRSSLVRFMRSKYWIAYTADVITTFWGIKAEMSDAVIILIKWEKLEGLHYISGISTGKNSNRGGSFVFYNSGLLDRNGNSIDGKAMSIWTFLEYVKINNATPLYFIGGANRREWTK